MHETPELIRFDPNGAFLDTTGISRAQLRALAPQLEAARHTVLHEDADQSAQPQTIPPEKQPLDAAFLPLPEQILAEYREQRGAS